MPSVASTSTPVYRPRLWEKFLQVKADDPEDIRRFCRDHSFLLLRTTDQKTYFVTIDSDKDGTWALQSFRAFHSEFKTIIARAAADYATALDEIGRRGRLKKLVKFAEFLTQVLGFFSWAYLRHLAPVVQVTTKGRIPHIRLGYVAADPSLAGIDQGVDSILPEVAEAVREGRTILTAVGSPDANQNDPKDLLGLLTDATRTTTVGHVFLDLIKALEDALSSSDTAFLVCDGCGHPFVGTNHQREHRRRTHNVFCYECRGGSRREYIRKYMQRYRKAEREVAHEKTSGTR